MKHTQKGSELKSITPVLCQTEEVWFVTTAAEEKQPITIWLQTIDTSFSYDWIQAFVP
jgi:predicted acetyltransferase